MERKIILVMCTQDHRFCSISAKRAEGSAFQGSNKQSVIRYSLIPFLSSNRIFFSSISVTETETETKKEVENYQILKINHLYDKALWYGHQPSRTVRLYRMNESYVTIPGITNFDVICSSAERIKKM